MREKGLAAQQASGLHFLSVPAVEALGQALEALRRRRGWSAAEAARKTGIDQSNLRKYEQNAKGLTTATLDRILGAYDATLEELAAILKEGQRGGSHAGGEEGARPGLDSRRFRGGDRAGRGAAQRRSGRRLAGGAAAGRQPDLLVQAMQHGSQQLDFRRFHGLAEQGGRGALAGDPERVEDLAHLAAELAGLARPSLAGQEHRQVKGRERLLVEHAGRGEPLAAALVPLLRGPPKAEPIVDLGIQEIDPDGDAGLSAGAEEPIALSAERVSVLVLSCLTETQRKVLKGGNPQLVIGTMVDRSECVIEGHDCFL